MTRHKELPIDDSKGIEQFKPNDRLNIYTEDKVYEDWILDGTVATGERLNICGLGFKPHWRQCRKIVEEKPREWEIGVYDGRLVDPSYVREDGVETIRVREVLEDE